VDNRRVRPGGRAPIAQDRRPVEHPVCENPPRLGCVWCSPRARRRSLSVAALRSPAVIIGPVGVSPDSRACSQSSHAPRGRAQGGSGRRRVPRHAAGCLVGAMPPWHRNSLGVGRVARRARPVIEPFSSLLPRLTLKAGPKAGLPTTPNALCGAPALAVVRPYVLKMHPDLVYV
jgi:hypothetical protein